MSTLSRLFTDPRAAGMGDSEEVRHRRKENLDKFDPELLDDEEEYEDDDEVGGPNADLEL